MAPYGFLSAVRLSALINALQDQRTIPQTLVALRRTPVVPAIDGEIMSRFTGYLQIADLVADDAQAVTYSAGKFTLESNAVPNLKLGLHMSQGMLNQMQSIIARNGDVRDDVGFTAWENRTMDALLLGVRQRMEALLVAMWIDGFSYNRLGIIMNNVSWGMPTDLKVTAAIGWATAATATPVSDIWAIRLLAQRRYGQTYNRLTLSTPAFQAMIATTEFQTKARTFLAPNVSYVNLSLADLQAQQNIATGVLGMQIELYDSQYYSQGTGGTYTATPFLAVNKIVFSNTADDNNQQVMDFANGIVTESIVAALAGTLGGDLGGAQFGPVSYATIPPDLNPPSITYWGVARGFPRKHQLQATAVLDIGAITDPIPASAPF